MTAYSQQTWADGSGGGTPISAARLAHMEAGIAAAADGTFATGVRIVDEDGSTVNGVGSLLLLDPSDTNANVGGLVFKIPGPNYGVGQPYGSGLPFLILSDSDAAASVSGSTVAGSITATTNATPVKVTVAAHGASTGDVLRVTGTGIGALDNKFWKVTRVDANNVTLDTSTAPGSTSATGYLFGDRSSVLQYMGNGSLGIAGAGIIHVGHGLRGQSGQGVSTGPTFFGAFTSEPSDDLVGFASYNATTTKYPTTPTSPFYLAGDLRSSPTRTLWQIESDGTQTLKRQAGKADSATVFHIRNDADSGDVFKIRADGGVGMFGANNGIGTTGPTAGILLLVQTTADADHAIYISRRASGTGNLINITDSDFVTMLSRFDKNGYFGTAKHAAPADADVITGEVKLWFDQTVGATKLMVKGKDSGGTVRTATIAMA